MPSPRNREASSSARVLSPRWWVEDGSGRVVVGQWPNPALAVWMVAVVVGWTEVLGTDRSAAVQAAGRGALVVWALDELVRGANPFRRVLGALVLAVQLARLLA